MNNFSVDPNIGDVEELNDLYEAQRDTEEYEPIINPNDFDDCMD